MKSCIALCAAAGAAVAGGTGPDVIVGDLTGPTQWGVVNGISSYSIGTTSCNVGTAELDWISNSNRHPVIGQNIFRIIDGRIEQLGQSYLKHGFFALQGNLCGACTPSSVGGQALGVGCSDPYGSGLNGSQGGLGPKSDIDPSTGFFAWPHSQINQGGDAIFKRCQVALADLDYDAQQAGDVTYLGEALYVAADDAMAGNDANNASYRLMSLRPNGEDFGWNGSTQRTKPAIMAWADHGLGVNQPDPNVDINTFDLPDDGVVFVGSNVVDHGDGSYTYYYAIENLTSDRGVGALRIPLGPGASATSFYFNDVAYHSGEPYDNTDWTASVDGGEVVFQSPETFAENADTNALRWGSLYTFGFTSSEPPMKGAAAVEYFKPLMGADAEFAADVWVPQGLEICNPADLAEPFFELDIADVVEFLRAFGAGDPAADLAAPFGENDIADVVEFLRVFGAGCP
ncbi:MAG: hypothetical protein CMJ31_12360 [Phycisphaerae bacterium]|nr:hypothetical protein [Phycisphaerae bacterium]